MATYLLIWNPNRWQWDNIGDLSMRVMRGENVIERWSCGNNKAIHPGDRIFLMKLSTIPKGIIASGTVERQPFEAEHWVEDRRDKGETALFVEIKFKKFINPFENPIFEIEDHPNHILREYNWTPQKSGIIISDRIAQELEIEWDRFFNDSSRSSSMVIVDQIFNAVANLIQEENIEEFSRKEIRDYLGIQREIWNASYSPTFQGMRDDQPGGAPSVRKEFQGVFKQVRHGTHTLSPYGWDLLNKKYPSTTWKQSVIRALHRFSMRKNKKIITRQELIDEELYTIIEEVGSIGATPSQTLSRVLQELREEELLFFFGEGNYLLLDSPLNIEAEELPDEAIDFALERKKIHFGSVDARETVAQTRQRKGQNRIRKLTLESYGNHCALCDVNDSGFLIASHIDRWADNTDARGDLSNVICLCRIHDALFEFGYISLSDDYRILKKDFVESDSLKSILYMTQRFYRPRENAPSPVHLKAHRRRTGFEE